jgi:hypothetical protein
MIAGRKVQEMLAQFNLNLSDVEKDDGGKIIEDGELMTSSSNPWRRSLAHAVARLYLSDYYWNHVKVDPTRRNGYSRLDRHNFIGLPHNVVVAKEMFVYFVDTVERLAKESRRKTSASNAYEHAFRYGCATRLTERIWERVNEMMAPPAGLLVKSGLPDLYKGMDARIQEHLASLALTEKKSRGQALVMGRRDRWRQGRQEHRP